VGGPTMTRRHITMYTVAFGVLMFSGCAKDKETMELPSVATDYVKQLELIETALSRVQDVASAKECVRSLEAIGPASRLAHERYRTWSADMAKTETVGEAVTRTAAVNEVDARVIREVRRLMKKPDLMVIVEPALKKLGGVVSLFGK